MKSNLKLLYCANLGLLGLMLLSASSGNFFVTGTSALIGSINSAYLCAKVPNKKELEDNKIQKIIELQSELTKLIDEKSWHENLASSQAEKLINERLESESKLKAENAQKVAYYQSLLQGRDAEIEELNQKLNKETTDLKTQYSAMISEIKASHQSEIEGLQTKYSDVVRQLNQQLEAVVDEAEKIKLESDFKIKSALEKEANNAEIERQLKHNWEQLTLAQKELSLEEKRATIDLKAERDSFKAQIDDSIRELSEVRKIAEILQAKNLELERLNEQLFNDWSLDYRTEGAMSKRRIPSEITQ
ncbi:hypothetical protein [Floridanema evergladense]|uniref:hypothetical protein n=1 Tax=Floridanema evergladense TaxID=3396172 RepID=UPI0039A5A201